MKPIPLGYIETSATLSIPKMPLYCITDAIDHVPCVGDVVYGRVLSIRQHKTLENKVGRIHSIHDNSRALFVIANRYAPDYYGAIVPSDLGSRIDLISRSGMIGDVTHKNDRVNDPTQIKVMGYVCTADGTVLNTLNFSKIKTKVRKNRKNKVILSIGTNMNSGKTTTAAMCCWALSKAGHSLTASKVTGTASLKDILLMQDNGARKISDFTYYGYPSTYMMDLNELIDLFNRFDESNNEDYWVVEFADGVLQRETRHLLESQSVRDRLYKIIFNAHDTFSAIGGINIMKQELGYDVDAISGVISGSPLLIHELSQYSDLPVINNMQTSSFKDIIEVIV